MATNRQAEEAKQVYETYAAAIARLRDDTRLSDEGRRQDIARAWVTAADKLAKLRESYASEIQSEKKRLEEKVLRPKVPGLAPTAADIFARDASFRAALDRAEQTENTDEMLRLLERSERAGDAVLVRAVLATAVERGDLRVLDAFLESHPAEQPDFERLVELSGPQSRRERLATGMVFSLPIPPELGTSSELNVRDIASGTSRSQDADESRSGLDRVLMSSRSA